MSVTPVVRQILAGLSADDVVRLPDAELLARFVAKREEAAFAVLVERHGPAVLGVCRRLLGHFQDTEDAAQAVFLILARNARRVRKPEALAAWLHGVAVRVSRKALSRRRKIEPLPKVMPASKPLQDATWADARRVIDEALAALPESLRVPLVLCYLEGLTRDEAANRLGIPLDTFRGRLERGREKLRASLARRGFPLAAGLLAVLLESPAHASHEWVSKTASLANGSTSVPSSIASLTSGILPVGLSQFWIASGVFATLAFIGVVSAAGSAPPPESPTPRAAAPVSADEPVPLLPKDRTGVWRSVVISNDGKQVERHAIRFAGANEMVWETQRRSLVFDSRSGVRYRYNGTQAGKLELTLQAQLQADGLELDPVDGTSVPRIDFTILPLDKKCSAFQLVREDARGQKIFDAVFRNEPIAPSMADPLVPEYLTQIDRSIKKEPKFGTAPKYVLIAFGPKAEFKVWIAVDGDVAYIDRNGNGDLTEEGERQDLSRTGKNVVRQTKVDLSYVLPGTKSTGLEVWWSRLEGRTGGCVGVLSNGHRTQLGGWTRMTSWSYAPSPGQAAVIHFGSNVVTLRPALGRTFTSEWKFALPDANGEARVSFEVGTPGVGAGNKEYGAGVFASYVHAGLGNRDRRLRETAQVNPMAEYEFTPLNPADGAKKVMVELSERFGSIEFGGKITVPDGVKTGLDAAKVTLSYPNCPWGKVEPVTYRVDVIPKK